MATAKKWLGAISPALCVTMPWRSWSVSQANATGNLSFNCINLCMAYLEDGSILILPSQSKDIKLKVLSTESSSVEVPFFNKENFNYSVSDGLVFFSQWKTDALINESTAKIVNVTFEYILESDLKDVKIKTIP